jgi:cellobiose dehydrogenase (acceptor)
MPAIYITDIDSPQTDTIISHPNISCYDWAAAWDTPIAADEQAT